MLRARIAMKYLGVRMDRQKTKPAAPQTSGEKNKMLCAAMRESSNPDSGLISHQA